MCVCVCVFRDISEGPNKTDFHAHLFPLTASTRGSAFVCFIYMFLFLSFFSVGVVRQMLRQNFPHPHFVFRIKKGTLRRGIEKIN